MGDASIIRRNAFKNDSMAACEVINLSSCIACGMLPSASIIITSVTAIIIAIRDTIYHMVNTPIIFKLYIVLKTFL